MSRSFYKHELANMVKRTMLASIYRKCWVNTSIELFFVWKDNIVGHADDLQLLKGAFNPAANKRNAKRRNKAAKTKAARGHTESKKKAAKPQSCKTAKPQSRKAVKPQSTVTSSHSVKDKYRSGAFRRLLYAVEVH